MEKPGFGTALVRSVLPPLTAAAGLVKKYQGPLKYVVALALMALALSMNWTKLKEQFSREPHWIPLIELTAIGAVCAGIQFYRWYQLVRAVGLPVTLWNIFRLGLVGLFYNSFLPGSIGGDLVKAYFLAKGHPERMTTAVSTVVADRLIGLFGLILFAAAVGGGCWAAGNERIEANPKLQAIVWFAAGLAAAGVIGYVGLGWVSDPLAERFRLRLHAVRRFGPTLAELWDTVRLYRQRPATVVAAVAMSAVVHTGFMFMFHLGVQVSPPLDPSLLGTVQEHFVIAPIGFIVQAMIPVPGGIGLGELTFGGLYTLIRGTEGEAVGLAGRLAMRVAEWTLGLIGYLVYLRMKAELPVAEAEAAADQPDPFAEPVAK